MDLRHLRYFAAVAEERHFGRAARRLHMAQPPLSRQIQALEDELGFPLFERTSRRVEITSAGAVLLVHVRRLFEQLDGAVYAARRAHLGETGRIAVGYLSSLVYSGITELLRSFRERHPLVELVLREMGPQEQIDALKQRRLDVGFVRGPLDDGELMAERVRREPLMVALPVGHRLAGRRRLPLALLANEPFIAFPRQRSPAFFDLLMRLCHEAGFTPRIEQEAPHLDLISLVAAGFGVSIVPASIRELGRAGIVLRPIAGAPTTELLVAWRARDPDPALRIFLEFVRREGVQGGRARR